MAFDNEGLPKMPEVVIYSRVSDSNKANQDSQVNVCYEYAKKNGLNVNSYVNENISASKTSLEDRELSNIIARLQAGDILIMSDVTRFGRKGVMALLGAISNITITIGAELHFAYDERVINKDNSDDAEVLFTVVGQSFAGVEESKRRSERAIAGHKNSILSGRRKSTPNLSYKLDEHNQLISMTVSQGGNVAALARELNVSRGTLYNHIERRGFKRIQQTA